MSIEMAFALGVAFGGGTFIVAALFTVWMAGRK